MQNSNRSDHFFRFGKNGRANEFKKFDIFFYNFNLFLEENHLKIGPENLFLAHEVCQMKPIFNKEGTYEKFFGENKWVFKFLPNAGKNLKIKYQKSNIKNNFLISFFNILAFKLQYFYMKSKITNEKVSLHQAFFHPGNLQDKILKDYQQKLGS